MRGRGWVALGLIGLALAFAAGPAEADRGGGRHFGGSHFGHGGFQGHRHFPRHRFRSHVFIGLGIPLFWPWWHEPPVRYIDDRPAVIVDPPVYVERGAGEVPDGTYYWYFCRDSGVYYPYVQNCATPWERVTPRPGG